CARRDYYGTYFDYW
nr:immunoglobulin heavy chain junction region [Mus musculus]MBK4188450.1 immunoglobulin heavy chain junction region [Mus musculus]MBK4188451.1 immunoglobulin heavy chain junction region [Mus musculus]